jgi:hypothetical protein
LNGDSDVRGRTRERRGTLPTAKSIWKWTWSSGGAQTGSRSRLGTRDTLVVTGLNFLAILPSGTSSGGSNTPPTLDGSYGLGS